MCVYWMYVAVAALLIAEVAIAVAVWMNCCATDDDDKVACETV